ncbi:hypothetical protein K435DRAFT_838313 [Dendrothele bispora CBS 962.96]|uniref:Uncharacterized protein n=1 Tax=Dendrothele bispora (strain CBS 962.96) TaxID=1314807 RepID=A0A4S8M852_DENBC|nr:hypothetical protein K435DRAFT_838313 [Dendrothele bispora CBS 962.96]
MNKSSKPQNLDWATILVKVWLVGLALLQNASALAVIIPRDGQIPILELLNIANRTSVCAGSTLLLSWQGAIPPYEVRAVQVETTPEGVAASTLFASFDALNATSCCIDIPVPNSNGSNLQFFFSVKSFDIQLETSNKILIVDCLINDPTDDQCTPPTSVPSSSTSTADTTSMASAPGASSSLYTVSDTSSPSTFSRPGPITELLSVPVTITSTTTIIQPSSTSTIISVLIISSQQEPEGGLSASWMGKKASISPSPTPWESGHNKSKITAGVVGGVAGIRGKYKGSWFEINRIYSKLNDFTSRSRMLDDGVMTRLFMSQRPRLYDRSEHDGYNGQDNIVSPSSCSEIVAEDGSCEGSANDIVDSDKVGFYNRAKLECCTMVNCLNGQIKSFVTGATADV